MTRWLSEDPINARVAKDDYENLGLLEKGWNEFKRTLPGLRSGVQAMQGGMAEARLRDVRAAEEKAARGGYLNPMERGWLQQGNKARETLTRAGTEATFQSIMDQRSAAAIPWAACCARIRARSPRRSGSRACLR